MAPSSGTGATSPTPPALTLGQPVSRGDQVRDAIQAAILDARLPQGTPLVERELSAMLGVSKTPIREALKQLQSSGLVVATAYQGIRVRVLDADIVRDVTEARVAVEPEAVSLAVTRRGETDHPRARQSLEEAATLVADGDTAALGLKNREFHRTLYAECGNDLLIDFLDKLQALSTFIATAGWRAEATYSGEYTEHRELLTRYERGDAEAARDLLRTHINGSAATLLRSLEEGAS